MARIRILDPTAPPPSGQQGPGPDAGPLAGKTVGIRSDQTWRSFEWVADEWATELAAGGAAVHRWCAGNRIGDEGGRTATALERFTAEVDIAVVGLGN
jgi:hypothetical protein